MSNRFIGDAAYTVLPTSRSRGVGGIVLGTQRAPSDPLFSASIVLQNIIVGTRYRITVASDDSIVLASGVADSTMITIDGVNGYANPMLIFMKIRNASGAPAYKPADQYAYLTKFGTTIYINQEVD